jgi:Putative zinc-finger
MLLYEGALMDHDAVVRSKMTERYLLGELDPVARDEFEEHFFDCADCALDVHAGALFVDQSKIVLAGKPELVPARVPLPAAPVNTGWRAWLRPAFLVPVMALLLAVIGYRNFVTYSHLQVASNRPQVLPWAAVNVGTYGSTAPVIVTRPGQGFLLLVRIPPEGGYSSYTAELYNPAGNPEWSLSIPVTSEQQKSGQDQWPVQVPVANREVGSYKVVVRGVTPAGESKEVGQASFELQIQK